MGWVATNSAVFRLSSDHDLVDEEVCSQPRRPRARYICPRVLVCAPRTRLLPPARCDFRPPQLAPRRYNPKPAPVLRLRQPHAFSFSRIPWARHRSAAAFSHPGVSTVGNPVLAVTVSSRCDAAAARSVLSRNCCKRSADPPLPPQDSVPPHPPGPARLPPIVSRSDQATTLENRGTAHYPRSLMTNPAPS